jgi:lipid-A-disaccharide synthase
MKVFVIAGEPSGDALGGALLQGLHQLAPEEIELRGIGGPLMQAQGLQSDFDMSELSLMGLVEILPKYFHLKRRISQTAQHILSWGPDVVITIDSPDFCLRVAKMVKAKNEHIRCVHYVAPTVWAWRPKRAQKMAAFIDQVLALLPFEPPYMEAAGIECDFVGHPITTAPKPSHVDIEAFRSKHRGNPLILCLPGSRKGEVERLASIFANSALQISKSCPEAKFILPAATPVAELILQNKHIWPENTHILDGRIVSELEKKTAFAAADLALAASGTVSLELAAAVTPMVIAYDMSWLSRKIMQRLLLTDTVTLVNLVSQTRVVPEFIGENCKSELIASKALQILQNPDEQLEAMRVTMERLGAGGALPGLRAARAVLAAV